MTRPTGRPDKTTPTRRRRNDRGLTTLEWLLIVAAVAGLAALAVVLVQNVVDETAEQISGGSARLTAARVAAEAISSDSDSDADRKAKCNRLQITYGDAFSADSPAWAALWSDPDKTSQGGKCFVVHKALKDALPTTLTGGCTKAMVLGSTDAYEAAVAGSGAATITYGTTKSPRK